MSVLADIRTRTTTLWPDSSAPRNGRLFTRDTLCEWDIEVLADDACAGITELAAWMIANEPGRALRVTLVQDAPLLFTELADAGHRLPLRPVWLAADDGLAVKILEGVCLEWDADHTPHGRCVWASYRVQDDAPDAGGV